MRTATEFSGLVQWEDSMESIDAPERTSFCPTGVTRYWPSSKIGKASSWAEHFTRDLCASTAERANSVRTSRRLQVIILVPWRESCTIARATCGRLSMVGWGG